MSRYLIWSGSFSEADVIKVAAHWSDARDFIDRRFGTDPYVSAWPEDDQFGVSAVSDDGESFACVGDYDAAGWYSPAMNIVTVEIYNAIYQELRSKDLPFAKREPLPVDPPSLAATDADLVHAAEVTGDSEAIEAAKVLRLVPERCAPGESRDGSSVLTPSDRWRRAIGHVRHGRPLDHGAWRLFA